MQNPRPSYVRFLLLSALLYGIALVPWPGAATAMSSITRALTTWTLEAQQRRALIQFDPAVEQEPWLVRTHVRFEKTLLLQAPAGGKPLRQKSPGGFRMKFNTRLDWLTLALAGALVVATPLAPRLRLKSIVAAAVLVGGFLCTRRVVSILAISASPEVGFSKLSSATASFLSTINEMFFTSSEAAFVVPLVTWLITAFPFSGLAPWAARQAPTPAIA